MCVCVHHKNVHLIFDVVKIKEVNHDAMCPILTHHDAIKKMMCMSPSPECHLDECTSCLSRDAFEDFLNTVFVDHFIKRIDYQCWQLTNRSTLITEITYAEDSAKELVEYLCKLKFYSF